MHALIVVSHPLTKSLTHSVADRIVDGVRNSPGHHTVEIADLAAERFDPRFSSTDIDAHLHRVSPADDVLAEQVRVDRADALVLVYPIYWWSMPGLLKGWIDRVFTNGWAYVEGPDTPSVKKLGHLAIHLVALGGADQRTYARHGYFGAMKMQIDHGIFGYCGARVLTSELLIPAGDSSPDLQLKTAESIGRNLFARIHLNAA